MDRLYFVILDDTYPLFDPIYTEIDRNSLRHEIEDGIRSLVEKYKSKSQDDSIDDLIEGCIYEISDDIFCVDQSVINFDKYYTLLFAINKDPCIVQGKGCPKRKYYWDYNNENKP